MEELYNIGISEKTLKDMFEINYELKGLTNKQILEKKIILSTIGCSEIQILNIISSNPMYLSKTNNEVTNLIKYLLEIGFETLNILFDSNPYILNLESFEIEEYINKKITEGYELGKIIDDLDSNPFLFNEI